MHDQSGGALFKRGARERQRSAPDGDEHLLALIREGDVRAFESVYRNYYGPLTRFLQRLTRRPQVTEEVLNDTMLVLWHRPESFRGDSKLSTWMFGIAYRKAMKALRRLDEPAEDRHRDADASSDDNPERDAHNVLRHSALIQAMGKLSPEHRAVVDLTYFHELGYREIAEIVGCPVDTVKTRMFHARRILKRELAGGLVDWL